MAGTANRSPGISPSRATHGKPAFQYPTPQRHIATTHYRFNALTAQAKGRQATFGFRLSVCGISRRMKQRHCEREGQGRAPICGSHYEVPAHAPLAHPPAGVTAGKAHPPPRQSSSSGPPTPSGKKEKAKTPSWPTNRRLQTGWSPHPPCRWHPPPGRPAPAHRAHG
jgi:hypothetical protein